MKKRLVSIISLMLVLVMVLAMAVACKKNDADIPDDDDKDKPIVPPDPVETTWYDDVKFNGTELVIHIAAPYQSA